jgi:hypothetical protein
MADVVNECRDGSLRFVRIGGTRMFELLSIAVRDKKALNPSAAKAVEIFSSTLNELAKA